MSERPDRSRRHTPTLSPASACSSNRVMPGRSITVRPPDVTSVKTLRFCMPTKTSESSWSCAS